MTGVAKPYAQRLLVFFQSMYSFVLRNFAGEYQVYRTLIHDIDIDDGYRTNGAADSFFDAVQPSVELRKTLCFLDWYVISTFWLLDSKLSRARHSASETPTIFLSDMHLKYQTV